MRIVVIIFLIVLGLSASLLGFIVLQVDPSAFQPQLTQQLKETFHAEVALAPVSIQWRKSPWLEANGIQVMESGTNDLMLRSGKVRIKVGLLALLFRRMEIKSLSMESPTIMFVRREDKTWNWDEALSVLKSIPLSATSATFNYRDETQAHYFSFQIQNLDLKTQAVAAGPLLIQFEVPFAKLLKAEGTVRLDRSAQAMQLLVKAGPYLSAEIQARGLSSNPQFDIRGHVKDVPLSELLPTAPVKGKLSVAWEGTGEGLVPEEWAPSLRLKAGFAFEEGLFEPVNAVQRCFRHLAVIPVPGLADLSQSEFPLDFDGIVQNPGTPFKEWLGKFQVSEGKLFFDEMFINHPDYTIHLGGSLNLTDRYASLRGALAFSQSISEILVTGVPILQSLKNAENEVLIPIEYRGNLQNPDIFVDVDFVANRFVEIHGEELMSLGIQKLNDFLEAHRS